MTSGYFLSSPLLQKNISQAAANLVRFNSWLKGYRIGVLCRSLTNSSMSLPQLNCMVIPTGDQYNLVAVPLDITTHTWVITRKQITYNHTSEDAKDRDVYFTTNPYFKLPRFMKLSQYTELSSFLHSHLPLRPPSLFAPSPIPSSRIANTFWSKTLNPSNNSFLKINLDFTWTLIL
jgi:hypothetical protein